MVRFAAPGDSRFDGARRVRVSFIPDRGGSMARPNTMQLDTDDRFTELELELLDADSLQLPGDLAGDWTVVLAYRGHW
jgi:hypothetical protein